jgi:hypothetical protein
MDSVDRKDSLLILMVIFAFFAILTLLGFIGSLFNKKLGKRTYKGKILPRAEEDCC